MECNEIYSISSFIHPQSTGKELTGFNVLLKQLLSSDSSRISREKKIKLRYNVFSVSHRAKEDKVSFHETSSDLPDQSRKCHIRKDLLWIKIFYFSFIGAIGCALPYVAVFLKQMGLGPIQIGLISGMKPIVGFLSGPLWGTLADKFNIHRAILMFSLLAWLGFYIGLFFIPPANRNESCPQTLLTHRDHILIRRSAANESSGNFSCKELNTNCSASKLSLHEVSILREHLGWSYQADQLHSVFIACLLVIIGGEFFQAPTTALSDTGTIKTLGPARRDDYGAQRAWGAIGWALCSFIGGGIVSTSRETLHLCGVDITVSDYHTLVYVFIAFMVVAVLCASTISFENSQSRDAAGSNSSEQASSSISNDVKHSFKSIISIFCNGHYVSWLLTAFYVGICNGFIWGFLFWHLDSLGASQLLMGVDSVVACIAEFISFFLVSRVIKSIGHMGIMYLGLIGYAIRFIVYAFLSNPWWVLPADILQGVTFSAIWISLTAYTAEAVPVASLATVQGILHGVYFGLGNGVGHLLGGVLIGHYGAKVTFLSMAVCSGVVFVVFLAAQKLTKKPSRRQSYQDISKTVA